MPGRKSKTSKGNSTDQKAVITDSPKASPVRKLSSEMDLDTCSEMSSMHSEVSDGTALADIPSEVFEALGKRPRRNTNEDLIYRKKKNRASRIFKSLIALDSYDTDLADNMQQEELYNENTSSESARLAEKAAEEEKRREAAHKEFMLRDEKFEAECPEEYKHFRPKGYGFNLPPKDRPIRIYADGVFDLFHLGHMKQLEQCKKALPNVHMIVGVPSDKLTHKYKGLTVLTDKQRCESLEHCKWVDEVVADVPWSITQDFIDKHQIDYVAHDDIPYESAGSDDVYAFVKEKGMFLTTQRTEGVSTSDIITRIVKDYDLYLMRNFARGVSRKELNVSWLKKNELDIKRHVIQFRENFNKNTVPKTRDLYADAMGLMQSVLKTRGDAEKFKSSFQGEVGGKQILGGVRKWVKKISSEASSDVSDHSDIETTDNKSEHVSESASEESS